jgi:RNA-directed DNA polymerase
MGSPCEEIVIRYADDIVLGFQWGTDADRFRKSLGERLGKFGFELHSDKTRRIEFGRYAEQKRKRRGEGKAETFDFLGFTHISGNGSFAVRRMTVCKRRQKKLQGIKQQLRIRMHDPVPQKQLRLQTARQRMLVDGIDATSAAYEVGYERVNQFNREYRRFFGQPPFAT